MSTLDYSSLSFDGVQVDETGEIAHSGPLATTQRYSDYTEEQHCIWRDLYLQQRKNLADIAYQPWLDAMDVIGLNQNHIPRLADIALKLRPLTGWMPVPISGFLDARDYFEYLSKRRFPTVATLRTREEFEFIVLPDLFHDAFGHLPMHSHPEFANFLQLFGETAFRAKTDEQITQMQRLYWFTVEYCLIDIGGKLKVCGSGHMSGIKESRYSLTNAVEKRPFDIKAVCNQPFNPHELQPVMFVIESYSQLYDAMLQKSNEFEIQT